MDRFRTSDVTITSSNLPFSLSYSLSQFNFPEGLFAAYDTAPRGTSGRVVVCRRKEDGATAAVKIITPNPDMPDARGAFYDEARMLLHIRNKVDFVRELEARSGGWKLLTIADQGARHVAYAFGTGLLENLEELSVLGIPGKTAFVIVSEPLSQTLSSFVCSLERPVEELMRVAYEISLALAFMAHHGVVVSTVIVPPPAA